ncbi:MAG TPA: ABC transporter permease [Methanomassiliicoccales archaeon]
MTEAAWYRQPVIELKAAWAIAKKDMRIYYIKPNIIVSGIMFPLFMFLAFSVSTTAGPELLVPGLIAITILFSASSIEPVSIPIERRTKTFDRLLSAPVSLNSVVLGESLSGFLYSIGIAFIPLVAGILIFGLGVVSILPLVLGLLLTSFCIASMGTLFASYPTESPGDIMSMLNLVRLPLVFISGVFIPLASIPSYAQFVTYFSPLTYGFDLIHAAYTGTSHFDPLVDVGMLVLFIVIFQVAADRLYDRYKA